MLDRTTDPFSISPEEAAIELARLAQHAPKTLVVVSLLVVRNRRKQKRKIDFSPQSSPMMNGTFGANYLVLGLADREIVPLFC